MRISKESKPGSIAGAIAGELRTNGNAVVEVIGTTSVYIAVKAIALAEIFMQREGYSIKSSIKSEEREMKSGETNYTVYVFRIEKVKI